MIHHVSIGVRDLAHAGRFYDAALGALGLRRVFEDDTALGYGVVDDQDAFCLKLAADAAPPGAGSHLAFAAASRGAVDAFHRQALQVGGSCNGAPGLRLDYGEHYYAAFLVDPDGYRIEAVCKAPGARRDPPGPVTLTEVDEDNVEALMEMELPAHQRELLASNAFSIGQAAYNPGFVPRAIRCGDQLAGFLLYDRNADPAPGHYAIYRFMVDYPWQGRGIGRRALELLLAELRSQAEVRRISICYHPRNVPAQAFYASLGFREAGLDEQGEMIAEIVCQPATP